MAFTQLIVILNLTGYQWAKISGPTSFIIVNTNSVRTQVTNLVEGIYEFELKVTDAGGLFSKDTLQVTVNGLPPNSSCPPVNRSIINVQLVPVGNLSIARNGMTTTVSGNKIFFAGGYNAPGFLSRVDIYDVITNTWSTGELSKPRVDLSAVASMNKVFFAGGYENSGNSSTRIDIYDVTTNTWSIAELSQPRQDIVTAKIGNKVFFQEGATIIIALPTTLISMIYQQTHGRLRC